MPKDRKITRFNRKQGQLLDRKNMYGINDPTPYEAVKRIVEHERHRATQSA